MLHCMKKKLHVLYVPGIGDDNVTGQELAVRTWKLWGVDAELCQMRWADGEPWTPKRNRLLARIDELTKQGIPVAITGSSAGATAVINVYAVRKDVLVGCALIAGKVHRPDQIGESYRQKNPAFLQSAQECEKSLETLTLSDRQRILARRAIRDSIVPKPHSYISGAHNQVVPTVGHAVTIATQLLFGAPGFLGFLKSLAHGDTLTSRAR